MITMRTPCSSSEECGLINAASKGIERQCFERIINSNETFVCDCNPTIGLTGEFCDEFSAQTWLTLLLLLIRIIPAIVGLILALCLLKSALTILKTLSKNREPLLNDIIVILFGILALCFEIIPTTFDILLLFDPTSGKLYTLYPDTPDEIQVIVSTLGDSFAYLSIGSLFFSFLSATVIVISWLNVLKQIFEQLKTNHVFKIQIVKRVIYSIVSLLFILTCIFLIISAIDAIIAVVGFSSLFSLSLLIFGRRVLLSSLKMIPNTSNKEETINRIRKFSRNVLILMSLLLCLNITNFIFQDFYLAYEPGDINFVSIIYHSIHIVKNIIVLCNLLFIYQLLKTMSLNQKNTNISTPHTF